MKSILDLELPAAAREAPATRRDPLRELAPDKRDSMRVALWAESLARVEEILEVLTNIHTVLAQRPAAAAVPATAPTSASDRQAAYEELVSRIRELVNRTLPPGATILVVSKGDDALLQLGTRRAWHFPQLEGRYAGFYPPDSASAIAHLELLREKGAQYLLFPQTALWWLDHYTGLRAHLEGRYSVAARKPETCLVFALNDTASPQASTGGPANLRYEHLVRQIRELVASVFPAKTRIAVVSRGDPEMLKLGDRTGSHFPQGEDGQYAGHYPPDAEAAIAAIERVRAKGAEFILFPATALWWLNHYPGLRRNLETEGRLVICQEHVCEVFDLRRKSS